MRLTKRRATICQNLRAHFLNALPERRIQDRFEISSQEYYQIYIPIHKYELYDCAVVLLLAYLFPQNKLKLRLILCPHHWKNTVQRLF